MLTIELKDLLVGAVLVALFVLVIYLIVLVANMIQTVKKANAMLDDSKVISGIAAERANQLNDVVSDVAESVAGFATSFNGNESVISSIKGLTRAVKSVANTVRKRREK
ncbi:MAG: hypothetical protein PUK21_07150 [Peptostreptococcaceae bacterium]|nr:hypothetical protein [Peptostreptococcaceae bacterium]SFD99039.1 hypothetical protein SAMN02910327_00009 [Peptostreptococcaceae bacterium pGA-8]